MSDWISSQPNYSRLHLVIVGKWYFTILDFRISSYARYVDDILLLLPADKITFILQTQNNINFLTLPKLVMDIILLPIVTGNLLGQASIWMFCHIHQENLRHH